jgi:DNA repair exonuclease SbcCD ATPase subunit
MSNTEQELDICKFNKKKAKEKFDESDIIRTGDFKLSIQKVMNTISDIQNKKESISSEILKIRKEISEEISKSTAGLNEKLLELNNKKYQIEIILSSIEKLKKKIDEFSNELLVLATTKDMWADKFLNADKEAKYINLEPVQKSLQENRDLIAKLNKDERQERVIIDYFKLVENLVSDSGIKAQIIKNYLPILVSKVNEYLALFSAEYTIEFTEEFDVRIQLRKNEYVDYDNFSGGEKIRIDLALIFSFVSFIKMKTGVMCSLLFFDEILDSSLDMNGITQLVQILNLFSTTGFTVMVVSHREENRSEDFKKIFEIKKEKFSKIMEV